MCQENSVDEKSGKYTKKNEKEKERKDKKEVLSVGTFHFDPRLEIELASQYQEFGFSAYSYSIGDAYKVPNYLKGTGTNDALKTSQEVSKKILERW